MMSVEDRELVYLLPSGNEPSAVKNFHKGQTLHVKNGCSWPLNLRIEDGYQPLEPMDPYIGDDTGDYDVTQPFIPRWVLMDKKVLRWFGYFKEPGTEPARIRHIILYYYLEDDTIAVVEPPTLNSGIPQGTLLKRQQVSKGTGKNIITWKDLNVSMDLPLYGRVYRLCDCDAFTEDFLVCEGIQLNESEDVPVDCHTKQQLQTRQAPLRTTPSTWDKKKQFLEMDRKVLRYYCVWKDGDHLRPFILHYYLADNTIEIRETREPGRDRFPVLLRRQRLPKLERRGALRPEMSDEEQKKECYTAVDLKIGETILVYGRRFLIHNCDDATKEYQRVNFGVTDFTPLDVNEPQRMPPEQDIPPYTGFGSPEDSLQSCLSLMPKPPKTDLVKKMIYDKKVLRFEAHLESDPHRRFIISYYLSDDTIAIHEPEAVVGKMFLKRSRVPRANSKPEDPIYYNPGDFSCGSVLDIFTRKMVITNADRIVLNYMEDNFINIPAATISSWKDYFSEQQQPKEDVIPQQQPKQHEQPQQKKDKVRFFPGVIHWNTEYRDHYTSN